MTQRRPQINFQVDPSMKSLYEEVRENGHWVTRWCAAGLLAMVEDAEFRQAAINRLREWEAQFEHASPDEIRAFVQGVERAMQRGARDNRPARKAPRRRKKGESE